MSLLDILFVAVSWLICSLIVGLIVGRAIKLGNRQPRPPRGPWSVMHENDPRRPMRKDGAA